MRKGARRNKPLHDVQLDRPILIHVCKDRTLSYRARDEEIFNGVALPVFSVDTKDEAESLIVLVGTAQYEEHPQIPGKIWRKISVGFKQHIELSDLPEVTAKLDNAYKVLKLHS